MSSQHSKWMQFSLGVQVNLMRFFSASKSSKMYSFPVYRYSRLEAPCAQSGYAKKQIAPHWSSHILKIFGAGGVSKVNKTIVIANSIDMVKLVFGKRSVHVQPYQTMGKINGAKYDNDAVAIVMNAPCGIAVLPSALATLYPSKNTCFWIVVQKRLEDFLREFHDSLRWPRRSVRRNLQSDADYLRPCRGTEPLHYSTVLGV